MVSAFSKEIQEVPGSFLQDQHNRSSMQRPRSGQGFAAGSPVPSGAVITRKLFSAPFICLPDISLAVKTSFPRQ